MDSLVSIIVPVYNVSAYLDECIDSLVAQEYKNIEIILIDDGSTDTSGEICDKRATEDPRIRVIHKVNGGAASARNAGIDAAIGEFICFVDSDDTVHREYIHSLLYSATENDADIAVCDLYYWMKHSTILISCEKENMYDSSSYLLEFTKSWTCSLMTNKLFKRNVIGSVRFEEGHHIDDEFFTYLVVINSNKIVVKHSPLYFYRMRRTSVMQTLLSHQQNVMLDRIGYNVTRYATVSQKMPHLDEAFFVHTIDTLARYRYHSKGMPLAQKELRIWINNHLGRLLRSELSIKQKLSYLLSFYIKKPAVMAEANPIRMEDDEYFD